MPQLLYLNMSTKRNLNMSTKCNPLNLMQILISTEELSTIWICFQFFHAKWSPLLTLLVFIILKCCVHYKFLLLVCSVTSTLSLGKIFWNVLLTNWNSWSPGFKKYNEIMGKNVHFLEYSSSWSLYIILCSWVLRIFHLYITATDI